LVLELEQNVIRYFFTHKTSIDYLEYIDENIFTDVGFRSMFTVYVAYVKKYHHIPEQLNFITFLKDEGVEKENIDVFNFLLKLLAKAYTPLADIEIVEQHLLLHIKKLLHTRAVQDSLLTLNDKWTEKEVTKLYKRIQEVDQMDIHGKPKDLMLLSNLHNHMFELPTPHPTCFNNFNSIIGMGGFFAPQLICILGSPKSMKTTFLLHLAAGYIKDGLNVSYIDWENGDKQIGTVLQQILLQSRVEFLYDPWNKKLLDNRVEEFLARGADLHYIKLQAKKDRISAAEAIIDKRIEKEGWKPDVLFYDYLDITGGDKMLKDRRERTQMAYAEAKNLNMKYDAFGITISKIVSGEGKKDFLDEDSVAEDKEKAYNTDSMFALMRSEDDVKDGIGWLQGIVQRVGESRTFTKVALQMDGATRFIADSDRIWQN
jgi:hypothetical protein